MYVCLNIHTQYLFDLCLVQVKNKAIQVQVKPIYGDPDLYISIAEPPTEREYMWRSVQVKLKSTYSAYMHTCVHYMLRTRIPCMHS